MRSFTHLLLTLLLVAIFVIWISPASAGSVPQDEATYQSMKAAGQLPSGPTGPANQPRSLPLPPYDVHRGDLLIPLDASFLRLDDVPSQLATSGSRHLPEKAPILQLPPGSDPHHIEVKFQDNLDIALDPNGVPVDRGAVALRSAPARSLVTEITQLGGRWTRGTGATDAVLDSMRAIAEEYWHSPLADLTTYFVLTVGDNVDVVSVINRLNQLPDVELATILPQPIAAPFPPDFQAQQGYIDQEPGGINASYAWTRPGGSGVNVTICDIEYEWNLQHQDLPAGITTWVPSGLTAEGAFGPDHGTAVLGELVSVDNGWGTTGAAYGAHCAVAPCILNDGLGAAYRLTEAITEAASHLERGDVILIEQQIAGPNYPGGDTQIGLVPVEWHAAYYQAIMVAVGNGIHVVEAAGNGAQNLDDQIYQTGNNGHWPFAAGRNSGAIMVGAGAAPGGLRADRSRLDFSNYGSRVDLQGWGERVVTTGYGQLYDQEGTDFWYTDGFGGTSSASPIVAAAVILVESIVEAEGASTVSPLVMRRVLQQTGSPQQADPAAPGTQHIGPRPNLRAALATAVAPFTNGTPPSYRNDDGSTALIPLSFPFRFYGAEHNQVFINNNGNLSFSGPYFQYTPSAFPIDGYDMLAAFWADVDTRNGASGLVYYRSEPHRFTVIWDRVGYYNTQADKLNTFEIIISDGTDPLVGVGKNVAFSFGDMQWTTGSASGGVGGFGGFAATVGANKGDGTNYAQFGRFDHEGLDYDGEGGAIDGVSWLDHRLLRFDVSHGAGTLAGTVYNDINGNCTRDADEAGLPGWTITVQPSSTATTTDVNGNFFFSFLPPNTYSISIGSKANWERLCPGSGSHVISLSEGQTINGLDFSCRATSNQNDLSIDVAGSPARPGFQMFYGVRWENRGTVTEPLALVGLVLPDQVDFVESSPGGIFTSQSHSVAWNVPSVPPGYIGWEWVKVQIPTTVSINTVLHALALINPVAGDVNPADNHDVDDQLVRGAVDPNEKLVAAVANRPADWVLRSDILTYQINFQNVGNDTAFTIVVRDTLDGDLDPATVVPGGASHPYTFMIVGHELVFTFANINLIDSLTNEPASHGFVSYHAQPYATAPNLAPVLNNAAVYFDYNLPVVTNTVQNTVHDLWAVSSCSPQVIPPVPNLRISLLIGDIFDSHTASEIDASTLLLNGQPIVENLFMLPSAPGFSGEVLQMTTTARKLMACYSDLQHTQQYTISGRLLDGGQFSATGEVSFLLIKAGDVDGNNIVNFDDVTYLRNFLMGRGPAPTNPQTADLNNDGKIDIHDLSLLVDIVYGTSEAMSDR